MSLRRAKSTPVQQSRFEKVLQLGSRIKSAAIAVPAHEIGVPRTPWKYDAQSVLDAVKQDGLALERFTTNARLQDDVNIYRIIVLTAVNQNGLALQYASGKMQKDKDIVLAAVRNNGLALMFASHELRNDMEVVLTAVRQNRNALHHASDQMQSDPNLRAIAHGNL